MEDSVFDQWKSKYIKTSREEKIFYGISVIFFFTLFVMPQYFGIPLPLFDLTALRIAIIAVLFMIFADTQRSRSFFFMIKNLKFTKILLPYLFVLIYTMILRKDINALLNPLIEILSLYLVIYIITYSFGINRTIQMIIVFSYLLTLLGIVEYAMGRSPFSYLETIKGIYTGAFVRSGHYRIMSSCVHSLGYGLLLITVMPFSCFDVEKAQIDLLKRPFLQFLFIANVFLTGSRSTLGIMFLELLLLFLVAEKENKRRYIFWMCFVLILFVIVLTGIQKTGLGKYILLQIATLIDSLFGTTLSTKFGGDLSALSSSSNYRAQLKYIFQVSWLNPILGIGRSRSFSANINGNYILSVDNFYIAEYIRYAYPGMVSYILFLVYWVIQLYKSSFGKRKSHLSRIILVAVVCYMINLYSVDSLQTLKYLYILFAIQSGIQAEACGVRTTESKYIKRGSYNEKRIF